MKPFAPSDLSKTFNAQAKPQKPKEPALPPLSIRVTPQEKALLQRMAGKQALSAYIRHRLFGEKAATSAKRYQEKPKQPKMNHVEIARLLGAFGQSDLVRSILALSFAAQAGQLVASSEAEEQIYRACKDIHELKTTLITALNVKPQEASPVILNGNQRGGAKDLAIHLMKPENERVELHELRGLVSRDLMGAFNEMYAISRGTRCQQFMYSLSLNPPKDKTVSIADFMQAIEQAEHRLGLAGQPRAVVFHEKQGRRHCHVVWSRIDITRMKAVQMSHDREKLTALSRELFRTYGWEMPKGLEVRSERSPTNYTHAEYQQAQRIGKNAGQIKADIQAAWAASDNRTALEAALAERGYALARGDRRDFVLVDRDGEVYSLPRFAGVKTKDVRARLGDGADLPSIEQVLAHWVQERPAKPEQELTPQEALGRVIRHHAAFTRDMMERTLKPVIADEAKRQTVMESILQSDEILKIGTQNGRDVYTTPEMIALERRMVDTAQAMTRIASHRVDESILEQSIFHLNDKLSKESGGKASLSHEQKRAIHHMTNDKQLALVVGVAGAGKTTIMACAKEALEIQGYRVRGAAPSGIAAAGLKSIGMQASTLHSLEARIQLAQQMMSENVGKPLTQKQRNFIQSTMLTSKDVLIVDEAGMVSAAQLARIIDLTKQAGAKLILVGDPAQLQSIEAGAAFRTLLERNDSVSLTEVRRQNAQWQRMATKHLSQGNIAQGLLAYNVNGCIHRSETRGDAKAQLVADVMKARNANPEQSQLVLAYTRDDVADLNAMIKAEMVKSGKVANKNTQVAVTLKDGDQDYQETQGFALGDRILFRQNNRDMGVMNGSFGTLKAIEDGQFSVKLDNGNTVNFSPQDYTHFQLGYASTVHKAQGMTVDQAFVLATPHFDRHTTYVAMSRHRDKASLYLSTGDFKDNASMNRSLGREGDKLSTLDFTDARSREGFEPERIQEPRQQNHDDQNRLRQQDIQKMREEFMRRAKAQSLEENQRQAKDINPRRDYTPDR